MQPRELRAAVLALALPAPELDLTVDSDAVEGRNVHVFVVPISRRS